MTWIETATVIANASAAAAGTGIVDAIGVAKTGAILGSTVMRANRAGKNGTATGSADRGMRDGTARPATKTMVASIVEAVTKAGATTGTPAPSASPTTAIEATGDGREAGALSEIARTTTGKTIFARAAGWIRGAWNRISVELTAAAPTCMAPAAADSGPASPPTAAGMGNFGPGNFGGGMSAYGERGRYSGRGPKGWQRSDERIREDVSERLADHPHIDASEIEVTVSNGEITLAGTVEDRHSKRLAEDIAESVSGVREVHNQIKVQQGQQAQHGERQMANAGPVEQRGTTSTTNRNK